MRITSTWLLTSAAQVLITIALGAFMLINAAVIGFYVLDAYDNYAKKESLNIVSTGRIHTFNSLEFTTNKLGVQRNCIAIAEDNGRASVREDGDWEGNIALGNFCHQLFSADNLTNWQDMAPKTNGVGRIEKAMWSIGFLFVFMAGTILVTKIPANAIAMVVPGLYPYVRLFSLLLTLPVLVFWAVFVSSAWSYHPSYWKSRDGYTVETEKVFIAADRKIYKAPETLFGWTDSHTMEERNK